MTKGIYPVSLGFVKAFLIESGNKLVLVDTGSKPDDAQIILSQVKSLGKEPKDVELCIITHRHGDHVGSLKALKDACGFKVASYKDEAESITTATGVAVDSKLKDRERLPQAGGIVAVHVPGHTKGNIALYLPEKKVVVVGDTIFADDQGNLDCPPAKYCEDVEMAAKEIKRLLDLDFDALFVAHGKDVPEGAKAKVKALASRKK